jgi:hypothetical protein
MKLTRLLFLLSTVFAGNICAQSTIGVGQWRDHLSYFKGESVTQAGNKIYCVAQGGLFCYDKVDNTITRESKVTGLTDFGVKRVRYHKPTKTLVIAYEDGNIDLLKSNNIVNLADIKRSTSIQGTKTINNIRFIGDFAYLCCNFGIVELDLKKIEIRNTFFLTSGSNANVTDLAFDGTSIYASTTQGVFKADYNNPFLNFFVSWDKMPEFSSKHHNAIQWFDNALFVNRRIEEGYLIDTLYRFKDGIKEIFVDQDNVYSLESGNNKLLISTEFNLTIYNPVNNNRDYFFNYEGVAAKPRNAVFDTDNPDYIWIADFNSGLGSSFQLYLNVILTPNGPRHNDAFHINADQNAIWVSAGRYTEALSSVFSSNGFYSYINNTWKSYTLFNDTTNFFFTDIISTVLDPKDPNHMYLSTWEYGLIEMLNGELVTLYNHTNSELSTILQTNQVRVGGMAFDSDGNLWMTNSSSPTPLVVKKKNGTWQSYSLGPGINNQKLRGLYIDKDDLIWIIIDNGGIALVEIDEFELASFKRLNNQAGSGNLPSNIVNCIEQDRDGYVWIGTAEGVAVFYSPNSILDNNASFNTDAQLIIVSQGGFNQYLLQAEVVKVMAIDGANRKWFGTENGGLFLISADGTQTVRHFTTENSPLFSNTILSLGLNHKTGELFVGTDKGIIAYRGTATITGNKFENVYAFPNPVKEDYNGPITITGLYDNCDVKITDVSGNVVFSTRAEGGQAVWNGNRYSGDRAATGVYLVFGTNDDGSQAVVTKILLIN